MPEPIIIVEYDPNWPTEFEWLSSRAAGTVGDLLVAVEHVGSTVFLGWLQSP